MKVTIAAGGTGGHVFPAVAVATELARRGDRVQWIGRPGSLEESEAKNLGADFVPIPLQGLKRKWTLENIRALARFVKGRRLARKALLSFRPEVVFALGSYVGAPVMSAALAMRIPVLVHEQNVVPGLVVRRYASRVTRLLLTEPLEDRDLKANTVVVGMPLRPGIAVPREERFYSDLGLEAGKKTLFVFGGSQGARIFCEVALQLARVWETDRPNWQILLQTGVANLDWTMSRCNTENLVPVGHLREMGKAYACADAIVSRSGAASCAEMEAVGKPAVLVPYPFATGNHQHKNAEAFVRKHRARLVPQEEFNLERLIGVLEELGESEVQPQNDDVVYAPVRKILSVLDEVVHGGGGHGGRNEQIG